MRGKVLKVEEVVKPIGYATFFTHKGDSCWGGGGGGGLGGGVVLIGIKNGS